MLKAAAHFRCNQRHPNKGKEILTREYKIVHLTEISITTNEAIKLIKSSLWTEQLNQWTIESLTNIMLSVLPRYIAGCLHPLSQAKYCMVHFGINDNGIAEGVLYDGILKKALDIASLINHIIDTKIICSPEEREIVKKFISFKIIKIKNGKNILETPENILLKKYEDDLIRNQEAQIKYEKDYIEWNSLFTKYMKQLTILFNEPKTRMELREYIFSKDNNSPVLDLIDSPYILEYLEHEEIAIEKLDNTSPYYWICIWRDELMKDILARKPKKACIFRSYMSPLKIIQTQTTMIPYWLAKNPKLKRYIVAVKLRKPKINIDIKYYNDHSGNIESVFRTISPRGDPCLSPLFI